MKNRKISTVGINPILSDPFTSRTSKLGWRYFEANEIDRNELQIRKKLQKQDCRNKNGYKIDNFKRFDRKKITTHHCLQKKE